MYQVQILDKAVYIPYHANAIEKGKHLSKFINKQYKQTRFSSFLSTQTSSEGKTEF